MSDSESDLSEWLKVAGNSDGSSVHDEEELALRIALRQLLLDRGVSNRPGGQLQFSGTLRWKMMFSMLKQLVV